MPSLSHRDLTHLGMDVHKDSISVGILRPNEESPDVERIFNDEPSVRRLLSRFEDPRRLLVCSEAGPTGFELHLLLTSMGIRCQVIAPSLIPRSAGDPGEDRLRDCRKLADCTGPGLVAIRVPTREEEAVRDLCRARADMVQDLDLLAGMFLKLAPPDLASGRPRQRRQQDHLAGELGRRQPLRGHGAQVGHGGRPGRVGGHDVGHHPLAPLRIGHATHGHVGHAGMAGQHRLDLGRADVDRPADHQVVEPVDDA
ncbi:MAG TPA: hypothetical protein VF711_08330, partial [Acidimicrobiales bacterium]